MASVVPLIMPLDQLPFKWTSAVLFTLLGGTRLSPISLDVVPSELCRDGQESALIMQSQQQIGDAKLESHRLPCTCTSD